MGIHGLTSIKLLGSTLAYLGPARTQQVTFGDLYDVVSKLHPPPLYRVITVHVAKSYCTSVSLTSNQSSRADGVSRLALFKTLKSPPIYLFPPFHFPFVSLPQFPAPQTLLIKPIPCLSFPVHFSLS